MKATRPETKDKASWRAERGAVAAVVEGRHGDPFAVLGMQGGDGAPLVVRVFHPTAGRVQVLDGDKVAADLERTDDTGFYEGVVEGRQGRFPYRLRLLTHAGIEDIDDPYRFPPILGELDVYLLAEGNHLRLYEKLGAHPTTLEGVDGTAFAVWAPNASRVSVVGPFNGWDGRRHPMRKRIECGVWELFVPGVDAGETYKFEILGPSGELVPLKADPFAFAAEHPPATASVVHGLPGRQWARRRLAGAPRRGAGSGRTHQHLRVPPRLLAPRAGGGEPLPHLRTSWPISLSPTSRSWASATSSSCRSASIPSTDRGATSPSAFSRRPAGTARPRTSPTLSSAATRPGSA